MPNEGIFETFHHRSRIRKEFVFRHIDIKIYLIEYGFPHKGAETSSRTISRTVSQPPPEKQREHPKYAHRCEFGLSGSGTDNIVGPEDIEPDPVKRKLILQPLRSFDYPEMKDFAGIKQFVVITRSARFPQPQLTGIPVQCGRQAYSGKKLDDSIQRGKSGSNPHSEA